MPNFGGYTPQPQYNVGGAGGGSLMDQFISGQMNKWGMAQQNKQGMMPQFAPQGNFNMANIGGAPAAPAGWAPIRRLVA